MVNMSFSVSLTPKMNVRNHSPQVWNIIITRLNCEFTLTTLLLLALSCLLHTLQFLVQLYSTNDVRKILFQTVLKQLYDLQLLQYDSSYTLYCTARNTIWKCSFTSHRRWLVQHNMLSSAFCTPLFAILVYTSTSHELRFMQYNMLATFMLPYF